MLARPNDNTTNPNEDFINYKFTREELKALEECNHESFWQRSFPLAAVSSGFVWYAVKTGMMKGSAKYGAAPKMTIASIVGYFIGKLSYQGVCAEKFMRIPDSKIGKMLRERQQKSKSPFGDFDPGWGSGYGSLPSASPGTPELNERRDDVFSDSPRTYSDLDTDRPITNFDDSYSLNSHSNLNIDDSLPTAPPSQLYTYEDLRRKNREEYEQSKIKPYARTPYNQPTQPPAPAPAQDEFRSQERETPPASAPSPPPSWNKQRNVYGDIWEK